MSGSHLEFLLFSGELMIQRTWRDNGNRAILPDLARPIDVQKQVAVFIFLTAEGSHIKMGIMDVTVLIKEN